MIILIALTSAFTVIPARADDGAPPPAAPSSPSTSSTTSSVLSNVPAGTDVVVVDHNGRKVALASQEAAHIVAAGDPIWCPLGVAPKDNAGGCSPASSGFGFPGLSTWMFLNDPNKAGVIWIEDSYQGSVNDVGMNSLTIDGTFLPNMANHSLALKGGWNGISGSTITNVFDPSEFDASVKVIHWHAPITISDIVVTGVTVNSYEAYALSVQTDTGGITLNRVQVINNFSGLFAAGAHLDTTLAALHHPAPVTVNDSVFSNNYGRGLFIQSDGAVNIRNLTADYNGSAAHTGSGAYIDNWWDNLDQPVTLTGTNEFKYNALNGLEIYSYGVVTLNNITTYHNDNSAGAGNGVYINNNHGTTPSIVKVTGTNLFTFNAQNGLWIQSNGNISVNNITSANNADDGALLDSCVRSGLSACPTVGKSVTLTGVNSFNRNSGDGLKVISSGAITISQVTANQNDGDGIQLDNCAYDGGSACWTPLAYNVTLMSPGTFIRNGNNGLYITTTGAVSLKNITASFNGLDGADIFNNYHLLAPRPVTIGGTNVFNGNYYNGLYIYSYGAITASNLTADDNGLLGSYGWGAYLNNQGYDGGLGGSVLITRKPVTLTGVNTFNNNYYNGLEVASVGAISLSNLSASNNGTSSSYDGVYLYNDYDWYPNFALTATKFAANVTISGFGFFESNGYDGLGIFSHGSVTAANLTGNYNFNHGAKIQTYGTLGPQSVTLSGLNTFYDNGFVSGTGNGLYVKNDGKITISNLFASNNRSDGAFLDNYTWEWTNKFLGVTLTGFNTFDQNVGADGLYIHSDGSVVLSHINADQNVGTGVYITATKNVTLMCASAFYNGTGFNMYSGATMTLTGVHAYYNSTNEVLSFTTLHRTNNCP
jgi:hypothetical protein